MATHRLNGKATASLSKSERTEVDYTTIRMINKNSVMFVWVDELRDDYHEHSSGILLSTSLSNTKDRWGKVVQVHSSVSPDDVKINDYILPEKTHDVFGGVIGGLEVWMTYLDDIVLVTSDIKGIE